MDRATALRRESGSSQRLGTVRSRRVAWLLPLALATGLLGGLAVSGAWWHGPAPGASDPGGWVGWGLPIARLSSVIAGTLTVGWLATAAFLAPQGRRGMLSRVGRRDVVRAGWAALAWCAAALATMLCNHAMMLGLPLSQALRPGALSTYLFAVDTNVAFGVAALAAAVIAACAPWVSRSGAALALLIIAGVGVVAPGVTGHSHGLGDHGLAITSGLAHGGASALWLGCLIAVAWHVMRGDPGLARMIPRYGRVANGALLALAVSGAGAAYARVEQPGDLVGTGYGWLIVLKIAALVSLCAVIAPARSAVGLAPDAGVRALRTWRWLIAEGVVLAAAVGVSIALTRTPNTRIPVPLGSSREEILGFAFPPPPTLASVLGGWHPEPFWLAVGSLLLAGYAWGLLALRRRGVRWQPGRTAAWCAGVLLIVWATCGQIAAYSEVSVSLHMLQHMVLAMLAPVFLVLGAPITLALRALRPSRTYDRGPREWIVWAVHHRATRVLTHPATVLAIFVGSLYGLYFTGLFASLMSAHLGHLAMQVHFVLGGYLFYWVLIGVDPTARQVPYWLKMIIVLLSVALHGFFGIAIMMMSQPLGQSWYGLVVPPWLTDIAADTYTAGGIAWALGELPTMIVMVVISVQWARSDERLALRLDRAADRDGDAELTDYNAALARLAKREERLAEQTKR